MSSSTSEERGFGWTVGAVLVLGLLIGCTGGGSSSARTQAQRGEQARPAKPAPVADARPVNVSELTPRDMAELESDWRLFVTDDPRWETAFSRWLSRGGAPVYVLSENFFRYFWSASRLGKRREVGRVAVEVAKIGEPTVALYVKALVTDRWPLNQPVTVEVFNPDNVNKPFVKTFTHYDMDDMSRQHASYVLASIGPPAVPMLTSSRVLRSNLPSARRYGAYALGAIATDPAVAALGTMARTGATWQDRGAATKGLGFALRKNPKARPHLEQALNDPDDFVKRKAREGLDGDTKIEF